MRARLAKDGARIVCRVIDCGAVLGAVYDRGAGPYIVVRPGYRADTEVFRLTQAAVERRRHGQPMRVGGRMPNERPDDPANPTEVGVQVCCEGRRIACFSCGQVQVLEGDELKAETALHRESADHHTDRSHHWHSKYWRRLL